MGEAQVSVPYIIHEVSSLQLELNGVWGRAGGDVAWGRGEHCPGFSVEIWYAGTCSIVPTPLSPLVAAPYRPSLSACAFSKDTSN